MSNEKTNMVEIVFNKSVSADFAHTLFAQHNAVIVQEIAIFNDYFVEVENTRDFVSQMMSLPEVSFAHEVIDMAVCGVKRYVYDVFSENATHGKNVAEVMQGGAAESPRLRNIAKDDSSVFIDGMKWKMEFAQDIASIESSSDEDVHVLNFSFGPIWNKTKMTRDEYKDSYKADIKFLASILESHCPKNLIITKAMGNEGVRDMDDIFDEAYEELTPAQRKIIRDHVVFVSAVDHNEEYSNKVRQAYDKFSITTVIINDLADQGLHGTSYAAPLLARWISEEADSFPDLSASTILAALRSSSLENNTLTNRTRFHEQMERHQDKKNRIAQTLQEVQSDAQGVAEAYIGSSAQDLSLQLQALIELSNVVNSFRGQMDDAYLLYKRKMTALTAMGVPVQIVNHYESCMYEEHASVMRHLEADMQEKDCRYIHALCQVASEMVNVAYRV